MVELSEILNWRRLNTEITLSGQPTEEQLVDIRDAGVTHVINLGPHSDKDALADEAGLVKSLGIDYVYIPVDFENPTETDFTNFCNCLDNLAGKKIHVHCIYNARVTAFFYRYAKEGMGVSVAEAYALMDGIWRPGGVWASFIGNEKAVEQSNQYAGYDY